MCKKNKSAWPNLYYLTTLNYMWEKHWIFMLSMIYFRRYFINIWKAWKLLEINISNEIKEVYLC